MDCQIEDGLCRRDDAGSVEGNGSAAIIAVTASVAREWERCIEAGMDDYIAKPVTPDTVMDAVLRWFRAEEPADISEPDERASGRDAPHGGGEFVKRVPNSRTGKRLNCRSLTWPR